jgi:hypothetical protein
LTFRRCRRCRGSSACALNPEIGLLDGVRLHHLFRGARCADGAGLKQVGAVHYLQHLLYVLLVTLDRWTPVDLSGQVAVVTGASRGAGRGIARVLAACEAKTYLVSRGRSAPPTGRVGTLQDLADEIFDAGGKAVIAPCDVSDDAAIEELFARISTDEGHLEILVNNAVAWDHEGADESGGDSGPAPWMYEPPWKAPRWGWNDNFTVGVYERLIAHCESIRTAVQELTGNKS